MKFPTLVQIPNRPLAIALASVFASHFTHGMVLAGFRSIFYMAIAIWAYAEVSEGAGWFRRSLGIAALAYFGFDLAKRLTS